MLPTIVRSNRLVLRKLRCADAVRLSSQWKHSFAAPDATCRCYTSDTKEPSNRVADHSPLDNEDLPLGSKAFVECDRDAIVDLFRKFAVNCDVTGRYMDKERLGDLLRAVGENPNQQTIDRLFAVADENGDGAIELDVRNKIQQVIVLSHFPFAAHQSFQLSVGIPTEFRCHFGGRSCVNHFGRWWTRKWKGLAFQKIRNGMRRCSFKQW